MDIYIPFTYIIGWSKHKKFYYGCKYAQRCQPSDLWESYFTSSEYVKRFRAENGEPDIIRIHRIFSNKNSCVKFEQKYLVKIDAKNHPLFLNESNGNKNYNGCGTRESYQRSKITWEIKYGVDNPSKSKEIKQKKKETCLQNWGYENASQSPVIKKQREQTFLERYGVDSPGKIKEGIEKRKQTCLEKYGYDDPNKLQTIKEKIIQTNLEKYGFESHNKSPIVKETKKNACLEKYGVDHISKVPGFQQKIKKSNLEKYGVDHPSKVEKVCKHCGEYKTLAHEKQCQLKPNKKPRNMSSRFNSYEVISPEGEIYQIKGKKCLENFAKIHNIKNRWTFVNELRCPGWNIKKL